MKKSFVVKSFCALVSTIFVIGTCRMPVYVAAKSSSADPVYNSMTCPSESQSDYMKSAGRDYGHITGDTSSPLSVRAVSMGALYNTSKKTLPQKFSVYLGKINLFAYSLKRGRWIVLDSRPYPAGVAIFTLPWETTKVIQCKNVTYTDSYAKIDLTYEEMAGNVLHFWGDQVPIDKSDYIYYACAYEFWVDDNAAGKLTATSGIDTKGGPKYKTVTQLYTSRGLSAQTYKKIHWGHTVPAAEYTNYNTSSLNKLFVSGKVEPDLYRGDGKKKNQLIDPHLKKVSISKIRQKNKTLRVTLKKLPTSVNGYEVQYSTDKKFKNNVNSVTVKGTRKTSLKLKKIRPGNKYYVRIRTYKNVGKVKVFSKWSKKKSITTK